MWSHVTHMLMAYLVVIDGPRARGIYDQMRAAYNSALRLGTRPIPPFDEWQGLSSYCDNYNCRLMEFMVNIEHGSASSSPPPQEGASEIPEKGPHDVPVHDQQQRGIPSATDSGEGSEGNSAVAMRPTHEANDVLRPNREPERASDAESAGYMESVPSDGRRTALMQPQEELTLTETSPFREVVSEPMVDSDACRSVDEQSSSSCCTELQTQPAEALLLSELSTKGTVTVDETEDEGVGVEDWLDVTHAMLDTSSLGLDLESSRGFACR
ncbi:unnamed protein product [Laminaria digitata]